MDLLHTICTSLQEMINNNDDWLNFSAVASLPDSCQCLCGNLGPIFKISYDLSYDYVKFIVRSTHDTDLKCAKISLRNIIS